MASREQRRAQLVPALAKLTRSRDFRTSLGAHVAQGEALTIIPVLPDDTMGYVFERVAAAGGSAVVAMSTSDGECSLAALRPASTARVAVAREDDQLAQIDAASGVGVFFDYLDHVGTAVVAKVAARLMSPREPVTA